MNQYLTMGWGETRINLIPSGNAPAAVQHRTWMAETFGVLFYVTGAHLCVSMTRRCNADQHAS